MQPIMFRAAGIACGSAFLLANFAWSVLRRSSRRAEQSPTSAGELRGFDPGRYRALPKLLSGADLESLAASGVPPAAIRRLRRLRRRLALEYLRSLSDEFDRIYGEAKLGVSYAAEGRSDFGKFLLRCRASFQVKLLAARALVLVQQLGIRGADVSVLDMTRVMEYYTRQLRAPFTPV